MTFAYFNSRCCSCRLCIQKHCNTSYFQMLESYLIENNVGHLLKFKRDKNMPNSKRKELVRYATKYLIAEHGSIPTKEAKKAMNNALTALFPVLHTDDTDGDVN